MKSYIGIFWQYLARPDGLGTIAFPIMGCIALPVASADAAVMVTYRRTYFHIGKTGQNPEREARSRTRLHPRMRRAFNNGALADIFPETASGTCDPSPIRRI
jgi:hypothetical protein